MYCRTLFEDKFIQYEFHLMESLIIVEPLDNTEEHRNKTKKLNVELESKAR